MQAEQDGAWVDYTSVLFDATRGLSPGQMIKTSEFRLNDAMSALEIMSSAMDSGYVLPEHKQQVAEIGIPLTIQEALWIVDKLFTLEVLYYNGEDLTQTMYTSIYYHVPKPQRVDILTRLKQSSATPSFDQFFLRDFLVFPIVIGTSKCMELMREEILKRHINSDEDFSLDTFGKDFWDEVVASDALFLLENSVSVFTNNQAEIATFLSSFGSGSAVNAQENDNNAPATVEKNQCLSDLIQAIIDRLKTRIHWLLSLNFLQCNKLAASQTNLFRSKQELDSTQTCFNSVKAFNMAHLGFSDDEKGHFFDKNIITTISIFNPIKRLDGLSFDRAINLFDELISELLLVISFCNIRSIERLEWFSHYFGQQKPLIFSFSRSLFQSILFGENRFFLRYSLTKFVESYISNTVGSIAFTLVDSYYKRFSVKSAVNSSKTNEFYTIKEKTRDFMAILKSTLVYIHKSYYQNQQRQRRVQSRLLYDIDYMQVAAEELDSAINVYIRRHGEMQKLHNQSLLERPEVFLFSDFLACTKLDMIESVITLGFPQDIYQGYEYPLVYWYLNKSYYSHLLIMKRVQNFSNVASTHILSNYKTKASPELSKYTPPPPGLIVDPSYKFEINLDQSSISPTKGPILDALRLLSFGQYMFFNVMKSIGLVVAPWDSYLVKNLGQILSFVNSECLYSLEKFSLANGDLGDAQSQERFFANTVECILNRKKQMSLESMATQYNLRFRYFLRLSYPASYSFNEWVNSENKFFDKLLIADALKMAQKSFSQAQKGFDFLKQKIIGQQDSRLISSAEQIPMTDNFIKLVDGLRKTCLSNSINITKLLNDKTLLSSDPSIFELPSSSIKNAFNTLYHSILTINTKKVYLHQNQITSNSASCTSEITDFNQSSVTGVASARDSINNAKRLSQIPGTTATKKYSVLESDDVATSEKLISLIQKNVLERWSYSVDYKYNSLWPCVSLTLEQKK